MSANVRAALLLLLTVSLFALSDTMVKLVLRDLPLGQVLAIRGLIICGLLVAWLGFKGRLRSLRRCTDRINLLRASCEVVVATFFFMGLRRLPLADATVLLFTAPLLMTVIAGGLLGESVGRLRWLAVLAGFAGVVLVAAPTGGGPDPALALPLVAAAFLAVRDLATRYIDPGLDAAAVALTTALAVTLAGSTTVQVWVPMKGDVLALVAGSAACIALAYVTVVVAYRLGEASFLSPFRYGSIPVTILLGLLVFGDRPSWTMLVGACVIVGSGVVLFRHERRMAETAATASRVPAP